MRPIGPHVAMLGMAVAAKMRGKCVDSAHLALKPLTTDTRFGTRSGPHLLHKIKGKKMDAQTVMRTVESCARK
jgi:hypothetical protein